MQQRDHWLPSWPLALWTGHAHFTERESIEKNNEDKKKKMPILWRESNSSIFPNNLDLVKVSNKYYCTVCRKLYLKSYYMLIFNSTKSLECFQWPGFFLSYMKADSFFPKSPAVVWVWNVSSIGSCLRILSHHLGVVLETDNLEEAGYHHLLAQSPAPTSWLPSTSTTVDSKQPAASHSCPHAFPATAGSIALNCRAT